MIAMMLAGIFALGIMIFGIYIAIKRGMFNR